MSIPPADWLDAVRDGVVDAQPDAGAFAQHVSVRATTGSTNDDVALAAAQGAPEGYTVIAGEQTAGRGRRGASWHSPAGHGLYLSTLLRPERWPSMRVDAVAPAGSLVTLMAGVAVVSAVADIAALPLELKWPNDVMVRTAALPSFRAGARDVAPVSPPWRKLAGILSEGASDGAMLRTVVVGIGVNVWRGDAPDDVAARMIALDEVMPSSQGATRSTLATLVSSLLVRLREGSARLAAGLVDEIRGKWCQHAPTVDGTHVRWQAQGMTYEGRAAGIDAHGALRVRTADGERLVHGGDVQWLLESSER